MIKQSTVTLTRASNDVGWTSTSSLALGQQGRITRVVLRGDAAACAAVRASLRIVNAGADIDGTELGGDIVYSYLSVDVTPHATLPCLDDNVAADGKSVYAVSTPDNLRIAAKVLEVGGVGSTTVLYVDVYAEVVKE